MLMQRYSRVARNEPMRKEVARNEMNAVKARIGVKMTPMKGE